VAARSAAYGASLRCRWPLEDDDVPLRADGLTASAVFNGAIKGEHFFVFVSQVLVPTLKFGDIFFLDKSSSHKNEGVRGDPLLAVLLARSQPDRGNVCEAGSAAGQNRRPLLRGHGDRKWPTRQHVRTRRVPQLPPTFRIWTVGLDLLWQRLRQP
jgi:hypothetical protein